MPSRADYYALSPELSGKLVEMSALLQSSSIERSLIDLVNIRVSQLNGCIFCIDMHSKEAKIHGERELRLYHLPAWEESPLFSARERAVLEWAEAVTRLSPRGIPDTLYQATREHLSDREMADLTFAVAVINSWNRLGVSFRKKPGSSDAAFGLTQAGLS